MRPSTLAELVAAVKLSVSNLWKDKARKLASKHR